jgi:MFS family permease
MAAAGKNLHPALRSLQYRNFKLFFVGQLVSLTGTWMESVAQSWLVYRLTGSGFLLGLVGFAGQFPVLVLAPVGGSVADEFSRHRIILATQAAFMLLALTLAFLTLAGLVQIWHIFVLATLMGVVNAFDIPARQAFLVEMVGRGDLMNAIALNSSMFNGARIIGPAVAGILVAVIGEGWCFLLNGVSYIAVIAGLLAMRLPPREASPRKVSALGHIIEGIQYVARTGPIRTLLLLLGLISLMGTPYSVLMPIFADQILHGGPSGMGLLLGASGVGALAGALTLAARTSVRGLGRWIAISAVGLGASLVLFSLSRSFMLSILLLIPVGFFMMVEMGSTNTLIQAMVPDQYRGRVMAVYSMMFMGMAPLGALLAGTLSGFIGAPATVAAGGSACLVGGVLFWIKLPAIRGPGRQLIQAQEETVERLGQSNR